MNGFALYGDEAIHELAEDLFDLRIAFLMHEVATSVTSVPG
jgi:hypothetical protein